MNDNFNVRIKGAEAATQVNGDQMVKEILEVISRFEGMTIGGFVRRCIDRWIIEKYKIDISKVGDPKNYKKLKKLPGSPKEIIEAIIKGEEGPVEYEEAE